MKKNNKLLLTIPTVVASIAIAPTVAIAASNSIETQAVINDSTTNADQNTNTENKVKPLVPMVSNYYNAKLSSKNGPITFWKETISSLDWFGAKRWEIKVEDIKVTINGQETKPFDKNNEDTSWKRTWLNYDLDKNNDILYLLSNTASNKSQYVVSIDVKTGNVLKGWKTTTIHTGDINNSAFFTVKVLDDGNVAVTGRQKDVSSSTDSDVIELINVNTGVVTKYDGNIDSTVVPKPKKEDGTEYSTSKNSPFNFIPIANNRNLMVVYNLTGKSGSTDDNGASEGTSEVWFVLVDDQFKLIDGADTKWKKAVSVTQAITGTKNSRNRPQTDVHRLLDGRTVTVIYDKLVIIDPQNPNNPTISVSPIGEGKWIESWSFDSSETLYFKTKNSSVIRQVKLDSNRNNWEKPNHVVSTYYDLKSSSVQEIKDNAEKLVLYNVYGYIGQIMLLNPFHKDYVDDDKKNPNTNEIIFPSEEEVKSKQYGLAVAITNNKNVTGQGDTKGLLNTDKAFQKSADFTIQSQVLQKKLPSEITREDITFENASFLTTNSTKNPNNQNELLYEPFTKNEIDDVTKKLKLTLHLDQIPWFVTDGKVPNDVVPLKITKEFTTTPTISDRFTWKVATDDYDFRNTLPSKLTVEDINRIDPLVSTLTSQKVKIGNQSYPKTTYSITKRDDKTGSVTISAEHKYLPMEVKASESNLKTYTSTHDYTIFKETDSKQMVFVGKNTTNVSEIPELKEIKESDILPSGFVNVSKQEYLRFIDTNQTSGYPLEKMNITATASDAAGTLTIRIDPTSYDSTLKVQEKTYTGLNKSDAYKFNFKDWTPAEKQKRLPSEINEEIFYANFATFSEFNSSDFDLVLYPNDVNGSLVARVTLLGNYPDGPTTGTDFKKVDGSWVAQQTFTGFKTMVDFNQEYQVNFIKENDPRLAEIQKLSPAEIEKKLKDKTLSIGGKTYTKESELIKLFIDSMGQKIPTNFDSTNIEVKMFTNNGGGEITWSITFKNLDGYPNPISFLETIGGFVKGNVVATDDVFTFANSSQLKNKKPEYFGMLPSQVQDILTKDPKKISDFYLNDPTGGYKKAIDSNEYKLEIFADDSTGSLTVKIIFQRTQNNGIQQKSLLEYSQLYTGLQYN